MSLLDLLNYKECLEKRLSLKSDDTYINWWRSTRYLQTFLGDQKVNLLCLTRKVQMKTQVVQILNFVQSAKYHSQPVKKNFDNLLLNWEKMSKIKISNMLFLVGE